MNSPYLEPSPTFSSRRNKTRKNKRLKQINRTKQVEQRTRDFINSNNKLWAIHSTINWNQKSHESPLDVSLSKSLQALELSSALKANSKIAVGHLFKKPTNNDDKSDSDAKSKIEKPSSFLICNSSKAEICPNEVKSQKSAEKSFIEKNTKSSNIRLKKKNEIKIEENDLTKCKGISKNKKKSNKKKLKKKLKNLMNSFDSLTLTKDK